MSVKAKAKAKKPAKTQKVRGTTAERVNLSHELSSPPTTPSLVQVRIGDIVKTKSDGSFSSDIQGVIIGKVSDDILTIQVVDVSTYMRLEQKYNVAITDLELVRARTSVFGE